MTSNVGATGMTNDHRHRLPPAKSSGGGRDQSYERMKNKVLEEVKQTFRPEFLNRVDEVVVFHQLDARRDRSRSSRSNSTRSCAEVEAQEMELEGDRSRQGAAGQEGLGSAVRRASAAPRDPAHGRGRARRGDAARHVQASATTSCSTRRTASPSSTRSASRSSRRPHNPPAADEATDLAVRCPRKNQGATAKSPSTLLCRSLACRTKPSARSPRLGPSS